jgi:chemotaxis family two-component system response regulator Rcp1
METQQHFEILSVDDNFLDQNLLKKALTLLNVPYNLNVVADGHDAIEFILKRGQYSDAPSPQLIFLDLQLPTIDGFDVLRTIKTNPEVKKIPIVVFSGRSDDHTVENCYKLLANAFFIKPSGLTEYISVVRKVGEMWLVTAQLPSTEKEAV